MDQPKYRIGTGTTRGGRSLGNSALTYYEYDDVGRVSKVDNRKSDLSVISTFEYEHDKVGNPTKITREDGSASYYQYDRIYQLTGETQVDDQGEVDYAFEYQYDKAHNRTVKVDNGTPTYYAYNAANELAEETTDGQTTYYHYDRCGNTVAKQEASGTTYYVYDTENLMTRIDFPDGGHNYFAYDADSKRVSKQDSEGFTEFVYQGPDMLKLLLERDAEGETQAHYTMGDGLEAMRRANGDGIAAGTSSFYHYNHLGTTHELTNADDHVTDTYRHDAWGVRLARTGTTVNPHTYVGRWRYCWMGDSGLYHLGFREYAPAVGRFLTVEPADLDEALFVYAFNTPPNAVDPSGLLTVCIRSVRETRGIWKGPHRLKWSREYWVLYQYDCVPLSVLPSGCRLYCDWRKYREEQWAGTMELQERVNRWCCEVTWRGLRCPPISGQCCWRYGAWSTYNYDHDPFIKKIIDRGRTFSWASGMILEPGPPDKPTHMVGTCTSPDGTVDVGVVIPIVRA